MIPMMLYGVSAGFPSPAESEMDCALDLNHLLIAHPAATFFMRVKGEAMEGLGIGQGDMLIVDRSITPKDKQVVVAVVEGELIVRRLRIEGARAYLQSEEENVDKVYLHSVEHQIWGIVAHCIKSLT